MFKSVCATVALLSAGNFVQAEVIRYSTEGHSYAVTCNESGYVLKSENPIARMDRFAKNGASQVFVRETETIYLGRSCDASAHQLGDGAWCWANGGFTADLVDRTLGFDRNSFVGFPRQDLDCPEGQNISWPNGTEDFQNCRCN